MTEINQGIRHVASTTRRGFVYKPLDVDTVHLRVYADASHATNDDLSSQIGYLVLPADASNASHIIDYSSRESRRVVCPIMGRGICAFLGAFDAAFSITADMPAMLDRKLSINIFADSKQLFDAIVKGKMTNKRRIMIEITSARQSYRSFEIRHIGLVKGSENPADGVRKIGHNGDMHRLINTQVDHTEVIEWVDRIEHYPPTPS